MEDKIFLTSGKQIVDVPFYPSENGALLSLPLVHLDFDEAYFIVIERNSEVCPNIAKIDYFDCELEHEYSNGGNSVIFAVDRSYLPAIITIFNRNTHNQLVFEQTDSVGQLTGLPNGIYEVRVTHNNVSVTQDVYSFDSCTFEGVPNFTQPLEAVVSTSTLAKNIKVYPNPASPDGWVSFVFEGFVDKQVQVEISDAKGKVIDYKRFVIQNLNETFSYMFSGKGSFNVRFSYATGSVTLKVIVL